METTKTLAITKQPQAWIFLLYLQLIPTFQKECVWPRDPPSGRICTKGQWPGEPGCGGLDSSQTHLRHSSAGCAQAKATGQTDALHRPHPLCSQGKSLREHTLAALLTEGYIKFLHMPFGIFFKDFIYLFDTEREREHKQGEQQAEGEGEAGSLRNRELTWGWSPGPWGHDPSWRQMLNWLNHPGFLTLSLFKK